MKLQVTLALLCMAFCVSLVNCTSISCVQSTASTAVAVDSAGTPCTGQGANKCMMYIENKNQYVRGCGDTAKTCAALRQSNINVKECAECNSNDCNKAAFLICKENTAKDSTTEGNSDICLSGACVMYTKGDDYIRSCAPKSKDCAAMKGEGAINLCAQCKSNDCNKGKFITCNTHTAKDTNTTGPSELCPSGTCIMYKKDVDYIRDCTTKTGDCDALKQSGVTLCAPCNSNDCNKGKFISCHENNAADKITTGSSKLCSSGSSGKCIMYKDINNQKYIRDCVDNTKTCSVIKEADAQCIECTTDNCNDKAFKAGSTFSLDVRVAAIALAGSLMILRSL